METEIRTGISSTLKGISSTLTRGKDGRRKPGNLTLLGEAISEATDDGAADRAYVNDLRARRGRLAKKKSGAPAHTSTRRARRLDARKGCVCALIAYLVASCVNCGQARRSHRFRISP